MIAAHEIVDTVSLEAWLETLPRADAAQEAEAQRICVAIAHRAAMRVLPLFWRWSLSNDARESDLRTLRVLRASLIAGLASSSRTPAICHSAARAIGAARAVAREAADEAAKYDSFTSHAEAEADNLLASLEAKEGESEVVFYPSYYVNDGDDAYGEDLETVADLKEAYAEAVETASVFESATDCADAAYVAAEAAAGSVRTVYKANTAVCAADAVWSAVSAYISVADDVDLFWDEVCNDCVVVEAKAALNQQPLYCEGDDPFQEYWTEIRSALCRTNAHWQFWIDWYDAARDGTPLNTIALVEIAMTDSIDWAGGAEHANAQIVEIVRRHGGKQAEAGLPCTAIIRRAISTNCAAIPYQIDILEHLVLEDLDNLRRWVVADELEAQARRSALGDNRRMLDAIEAIREQLPIEGAPSEQVAVKIGHWAEVLVLAFQDCSAELKECVSRERIRRASMPVRIQAGCGVAGVVSLLGVPDLARVAGDVVIGGKTVAEVARSWRGGGSV